MIQPNLIFALAAAGMLSVGSAQAATVIVSDNYNVTASGTGFDLNTGANSGINPPTTRLTGSAASGLRYLHTGTKDTNSYTIAANRLQVAAAGNPGRFVLSADGATSFDFATALGTASATVPNPVIYDLAITINNNSSGGQRCSFAIGTAEGDATTWSFGFQIYRTNSTDDAYAIGKRVDSSSSGLGSDLNKLITVLTPNTYANDITLLMRVSDAGNETTTFNSRVQLSLNNGNSWFYDTDSDPDLPNGWRLHGSGRHLMWDIAPDAGPVTYENFSLKLNPSLSTANTNSIFKAMTWNIHSGSGPDNKVNTQRIADLITSQNVDLVGLNEVSRFMARGDNRDLIGELSQETGLAYVFSNNLTSASGNDEFGNAILSRYPILSRDHILLPNLPPNEQRGLLKVVVDANGKFVNFWSTHLAFVSDNTERLMCVTNFNTWVTQETLPVIICGDFNETPDKTVHDRMELKWEDVWLAAGDGSLGRTSPCPGPLQTRIDYLWRQLGSAVVPTNASVNYTVEASDHWPALSQFVITNFFLHKSGFYFPFDEGSGTKLSDIVAGLKGTLGTGSPAWSVDSPTGQPGDRSLYFDGTKKITLIDTNQVIGTNGLNGDYTLQAWVKIPVNFSPPQRMILFQYERRPGFSFSINTNRTLHTTTFKIKDIVTSATLPNDGQWHHLAVVHTDHVNLKFYIDTILSATVAYTNGPGLRVSPTITIGAAADGTNPFTGYLDRVSFDSRALTPSQLDFPATPALGLRKNGDAIILSWPVSPLIYTIQANIGLQATGWSNLTSQIQGDENQFITAGSNSARFFRLKR